MGKSALITGITGQDGVYLASFLARRGYRVVGTTRQWSRWRERLEDPVSPLAGVAEACDVRETDIRDLGALASVLEETNPSEIYHLAGFSRIVDFFHKPRESFESSVGVLFSLLDWIRSSESGARLFFAGSSEVFGASEPPQSEETPCRPSSPYGATKLFGWNLLKTFREHEDLFLVCGVLFNHESPMRAEDFVTRKIAKAVAEIKAGLRQHVDLGNLAVRRDWGFAGEYVEAMWMMLQAPVPRDYVIATGVSHSVQEFCEEAFGYVGLDWTRHVRKDASLVRPGEAPEMRGETRRIKDSLGWRSRVCFSELVRIMVDADACRLVVLKNSSRSS